MKKVLVPIGCFLAALLICVWNIRLFVYVSSSNYNFVETSTSTYFGLEPRRTVSPTFIKNSSVLPDRLISVFGLESSGTTWMSETLALAYSSKADLTDKDFRITTTTQNDKNVEIIHLSLPWGWGKPSEKEPVDVVVPAPCMIRPLKWARKRKCQAPTMMTHVTKQELLECAKLGFQTPRKYPCRFFVNITSHIEWYQQRGVEATAVIMVRDQNAQLQGATKHARRETVALKEKQIGHDLMAHAMQFLPESVVLVSYEAMMLLGDTYLHSIYRQLGIQSQYSPPYKDGNAKYFRRKKLQTVNSTMRNGRNRDFPVVRQNDT